MLVVSMLVIIVCTEIRRVSKFIFKVVLQCFTYNLTLEQIYRIREFVSSLIPDLNNIFIIYDLLFVFAINCCLNFGPNVGSTLMALAGSGLTSLSSN